MGPLRRSPEVPQEVRTMVASITCSYELHSHHSVMVCLRSDLALKVVSARLISRWYPPTMFRLARAYGHGMGGIGRHPLGQAVQQFGSSPHSSLSLKTHKKCGIDVSLNMDCI